MFQEQGSTLVPIKLTYPDGGICTTQTYRLYIIRSFSSYKLSVTNSLNTDRKVSFDGISKDLIRRARVEFSLCQKSCPANRIKTMDWALANALHLRPDTTLAAMLVGTTMSAPSQILMIYPANPSSLFLAKYMATYFWKTMTA